MSDSVGDAYGRLASEHKRLQEDYQRLCEELVEMTFRCQRYEKTLDNMAMLIRRLVRAVPHDQLKEQAMDYLNREWPLDKNSILRTPQPADGEELPKVIQVLRSSWSAEVR